MHEEITNSHREVPEHFRCHHIFIDGHRCGSPALRNQQHCYYHHESRKPAPNPQARYARRHGLSIPEPRTRADIQSALGKVLTSLAFNDIDSRRAGLLLFGLQIASANITRSRRPQPPIEAAPEPAEKIQAEAEESASTEEAFPLQLHRITRASAAGLIESLAQHLNIEPSPDTRKVIATIQATKSRPNHHRPKTLHTSTGARVHPPQTAAASYTRHMIDEGTFRRVSDQALESLKQSIIAAEDDDPGFEFEDNNGVMNIVFENGSSKFVITPNTPIRQIWISAQATSYKLEWNESASAFTLPKTGEALKPLTERLLREHLANPAITLP